MNEITQKGIAALKAGDRSAARALLAAAVKQDPNDAAAWLWLSGAVQDDGDRVQCLQQVLRIDPGNVAAARGLAALVAKHTPALVQVPPEDAPPVEGPPLEVPPSEAASVEVPPQEAPAAEIELPSAPAPEEALPTEASPETAAALEAPGLEDTVAAQSVTPETDAMAAAAAVPEIPGAAGSAPAVPTGRKRRHARVEDEAAQVIFRTRPSIVAALIGFWVFLAGAIITGMLLRGVPLLSIALPVGLFVIFEAIVLYVVIRNLAVRYELTTQVLTLRFRGKRQRVPVSDIFRAEYHQTFFQRLLGAGDVIVDAAVNGEMARLRMRNISRCKLRVEQIEKVIKDLGNA